MAQQKGPPDCADSPLIHIVVAPAQAGAYLADRFRLKDAMGPSLRWGDGIFRFRRYPTISSGLKK
jgi:hypothetical protein